MATLAQEQGSGLSFWQRMTLGLAVFIIFCFAQFALRGLVNYARVPVWIHVHGVVMIIWLALTFTQATLAHNGNMDLHRKLGWTSAVMAMVVVGLGVFVSLKAVQTGHQPPFFTAPYFLMLTQIGFLSFGGLVTAALLLRQNSDWHRRLMLGSLIVIMDPALGRLLPMPLLGGMGEWLVMILQLATLGIVLNRDMRTLGGIHPATIIVGLVIVLAHVTVEILAVLRPVIMMTQRFAIG